MNPEEERVRQARRSHVGRMQMKAIAIRKGLGQVETSWTPKMSPLDLVMAEEAADHLLAALQRIERYLP